MRHPHADMIIEWAENPERDVQVQSMEGGWYTTRYPAWHSDTPHRFADTPDRISPPPRRVVYQRRVEVPEALGELPETGVRVWAPTLGDPGAVWTAAHRPIAQEWLRLGIAYPTREAALARRDAMLMTEEGEE